MTSVWLNGSTNHVTFLPEGECGDWQTTRLTVYVIHYYEISYTIIPYLKERLVRGYQHV
jgi:hypothetical protein